MGHMLHTLIVSALSAVILMGSVCRAGDATYIVSVVPQFSPTQIYRDWKPLLTRLEEVTGLRFQLRTYDQITSFETDLVRGLPDLALMNPYQMVYAKQTHSYRALVRDNATLAGILVTRADGPIKSLADLNGKVLAFPSPNALGASLYMRALLVEEKGLKFTPDYVGNHQNVYRQVLLGDAAAGGGVRNTLDKEPEGVQSKLRILYTTPELAIHPLAAHPRIPAADSKKIVDALLAMRLSATDRKLLFNVQMPNIIEADFQRDYEPLVLLRLGRHANKMGQ